MDKRINPLELKKFGEETVEETVNILPNENRINIASTTLVDTATPIDVDKTTACENNATPEVEHNEKTNVETTAKQKQKEGFFAKLSNFFKKIFKK